MIARGGAFALVLGALAPGAAWAEPPAPPATNSPARVKPSGFDALSPPSKEPAPVVDHAAQANLEAEDGRTGVIFEASFGFSMLVGFGLPDSVGRGGLLSLRLGEVATPHTVLNLELNISGTDNDQSGNNSAVTNGTFGLLGSAQYFFTPLFSLRFGAGLGGYQGRDVTVSHDSKGDPILGDQNLLGPAVLGAIGLAIKRWHWGTIGFEGTIEAIATSKGVLLANALSFGVEVD
jgi:hypothetical protein